MTAYRTPESIVLLLKELAKQRGKVKIVLPPTPKNPFGKRKKAQAGLEYLMTYGWALVLIAAVVGVLVFAFSSPPDIYFTSSAPNKLMVKGGGISGNDVEVKLQNITGGRISVSSVSLGEGFVECTDGPNGAILNQSSIGDIRADNPVIIPPGGPLDFACIKYVGLGKGSITIAYKDQFNLERETVVTVTGHVNEPVPEPECGNGVCDAGEGCSNCADCACQGADFCCPAEGNTCVPEGECLGENLLAEPTGFGFLGPYSCEEWEDEALVEGFEEGKDYKVQFRIWLVSDMTNCDGFSTPPCCGTSSPEECYTSWMGFNLGATGLYFHAGDGLIDETVVKDYVAPDNNPKILRTYVDMCQSQSGNVNFGYTISDISIREVLG